MFAQGGHFSITPTVPFSIKQNYLPNSNVSSRYDSSVVYSCHHVDRFCKQSEPVQVSDQMHDTSRDYPGSSTRMV